MNDEIILKGIRSNCIIGINLDEREKKQEIILNYTSNSKNSSFLLDYFESFLISLKKNTLNSYIKSVIKN